VGAEGQQAGQIKSMKLLTTDTGWAATEHKLFWTTDGGTQWKDITPKPNHKRQTISSVFFLDSSTGWVLLNCGDYRDPIADDVCFEFALTTSAGDNWSVVRTKIVDPVPSSVIKEDGQGFSGTTYLDFADAQHGWAVLRRSLPVGRSAGVMLRSNDGGRSWMQLANDTLPMAESFRFVNSRDGWLAGGPDQELYATHDAGTSWHKALLPKPTGVGPDTGMSYDLPVFVNEHRGFISVRYAVGPLMGPDLSTLALFATDDGGLTWRQDRVLPRLPDIYSSDLVGSSLIAAHSEQVKATRNTVPTTATKLSLYTLGPGQSVTSNTSEISSQGAVTQLSFVGSDRGWANLLDGLFSTGDAGKTWMDITPGGPPPRLTPLPQASSRRVHLQGNDAPPFLSITSSSNTALSSHLAFDATNVPTVPQMSAWITSSPFYDVYIYLPHSPNRHNDPILVSKNGPGWISSVEGQGWGLVPIWFGLQSTCVITQTGITQFINTTPATASTQGAGQADLAVAQDKLLGITSGIIYLDVENYKLGATCSAAVQAYVDGFVSEIRAYPGFNAGVYANPAPITGDISKVSPSPAAIWIAKADNQVTIWNQGISDSLWPNSQRMHQFLNNTNPNNAPNATWGGVPLSIDYDIDNGPVLNANAIAKPYLYTAANIDCPGAISTIPTAMNDMNNGAFINGPGQRGTVVGTYQTSIVGSTYGFQNTSGTCANITVLGSSNTEPSGINNLGQIVGYFEDSNAAYHGFLLSSGGTLTQIDYPGATATYLHGINDAGQIVGFAYSPETFGYQTFMYYGNGQFYPLGFSNSSFEYTLGYGINGDATLTGTYYYEPSTEDFELAAVPTPPSWTWTGTVVGLTPGGSANTIAKGINANGELTGFYNSTNCGDTAYQCGFEWSGGTSGPFTVRQRCERSRRN
jgi:probable HAF family extracellular repeat protein